MKKTLVALGILFFVCLLFFWPILKGFLPFPGDLLANVNPYRSLSISGYPPNGYPDKAQGKDVITEMYPWRYFTISELKQGRIPFWNPHNFSGNILMQNLQSSVFNPFNIFFFIFPFMTGWTLFILIQPLLASIFFYFFARELKLSRFAGVIGAIGFAFSSYMTVWMEYGNIAATLAYLPLLLFFLHRFLQKQQIRNFAGFVVAAAIMLLSGYVQGAFYSYLVAFLFTLYFFISEKIKPRLTTILFLLGMFILPLFLTLFQFLSTLNIFFQSTRWPYSTIQIQNLLQPVWYWVTIFASDFFGNPATRNYYLPLTYIERVAYIGIPLLFFVFFAVSHKRKFTLFFTLLAIVTVFLTTNFPGIAYFYKLPIPVINTTVPTRFLSIFMFCTVVLATFGIDLFFQKRNFPKKLTIVFAAFYTFLWIGLFLVKKLHPQYISQISITQHNLLLPTILAFMTGVTVFLAKRFERFSKVLLFVLVVIDLFYVFQKITPFAPTMTVYPTNPVTMYLSKNAGINRFWGYGSGYIMPNFQTVDGTYSPEGNDPLHMKYYGDLLASSYDGKIPLLPPRPDANLATGYGQSGMQNTYRQTLLNLLGIKYVIQHDESRKNNDPDVATFPEENYQLAWSQNPWQIYENKSVLPRYFLVNSYVSAKGQDALDKLYSLNLSKTVILEKSISTKFTETSVGTVQLLSYSPQKIVFRTTTNGSMLLFLSDTYYSSWYANIDGKATDLLLADYAFRAVVVPPGKHIITMYFESSTFILGILIAGGACMIFVASCFALRKYGKSK